MIADIHRRLIDLVNLVKAFVLGAFWGDSRYAYTSNVLDYVGKHTSHNAQTSSDKWYVWKYTWSSDDLVRKEGPLRGAWDDRASFKWGA